MAAVPGATRRVNSEVALISNPLCFMVEPGTGSLVVPLTDASIRP
jgi:hypothetical protein